MQNVQVANCLSSSANWNIAVKIPLIPPVNTKYHMLVRLKAWEDRGWELSLELFVFSLFRPACLFVWGSL